MASKEPVNIGIPFSEAKNIHLEGLYKIQSDISSVITYAGTSGTKVNYDAVKALVELAISSIPDVEQGNNCRELLEKKEEERKMEIAKKRNHSTPTTDDEQEAIREASLAVFNLIHVIYDDDIGIRKRHTIGVA